MGFTLHIRCNPSSEDWPKGIERPARTRRATTLPISGVRRRVPAVATTVGAVRPLRINRGDMEGVPGPQGGLARYSIRAMNGISRRVNVRLRGVATQERLIIAGGRGGAVQGRFRGATYVSSPRTLRGFRAGHALRAYGLQGSVLVRGHSAPATIERDLLTGTTSSPCPIDSHTSVLTGSGMAGRGLNTAGVRDNGLISAVLFAATLIAFYMDSHVLEARN